MTVIATTAGFAIAPQAGTSPGTDSVSQARAPEYPMYRWLRTSTIRVNPQQILAPMPMELSAQNLLPQSPYKAGSWVQGSISFIPRIDGSHLHWLLYSLASSYASFNLGAVSGQQTGQFLHFYGIGGTAEGGQTNWDPSVLGASIWAGFYSGSAQTLALAWENVKAAQGGGYNNTTRYLSAKRLYPAPDALEGPTGMGEVYADVRPVSLEINYAIGRPLSMQLGFVGRKSQVYDVAPGATAWRPTYTDGAGGQAPGLQTANTHLLGCRGRLSLPSGQTSLDLTFTEMSIAIANQTTSPQDEMVLFSYHPEGFNTTQWAVVVRATVKRNALDMYRNIFYGGGSSWSPIVWRNGEPILISVYTESDTLYNNAFGGRLDFWAQDIMWSCPPIDSVPAAIQTIELTGIVLGPAAGAAWYLMLLNNRNPDLNEVGAASTGFMSWPSV